MILEASGSLAAAETSTKAYVIRYGHLLDARASHELVILMSVASVSSSYASNLLSL